MRAPRVTVLVLLTGLGVLAAGVGLPALVGPRSSATRSAGQSPALRPDPPLAQPIPTPAPGYAAIPGGGVPQSPRATLQEFPSVPYDGTYTFVRVRFNTGRRGFGGGFGRGRGPGWAHDYPDADDNFIKILDEVTLLGPNTDGTNVIDAEDPDLHNYPIAYVSEPGEWAPTQAEVDNLASYLGKGGFLILDDFRGNREWAQVEAIFNVILPGHTFSILELEEPIFNSFFQIETLDLPPPTFQQYTPIFLGIHEGNDPEGRLMVIANFNNDIGDYWEYSDMGYYPIDLSNEAYKFGVNYVIYAMNR